MDQTLDGEVEPEPASLPLMVVVESKLHPPVVHPEQEGGERGGRPDPVGTGTLAAQRQPLEDGQHHQMRRTSTTVVRFLPRRRPSMNATAITSSEKNTPGPTSSRASSLTL